MSLSVNGDSGSQSSLNQTPCSSVLPCGNALLTSDSNLTVSKPSIYNSKNVGNAVDSISTYSTNSSFTSSTSSTSNNHHKTDQNTPYTTSQINNDIWMATVNQHVPLPNLTDAILETDIFYPLVSVN